jgi:hypothetical protein
MLHSPDFYRGLLLECLITMLRSPDFYRGCAADLSLLNLPKGKSLGRSKPFLPVCPCIVISLACMDRRTLIVPSFTSQPTWPQGSRSAKTRRLSVPRTFLPAPIPLFSVVSLIQLPWSRGTGSSFHLPPPTPPWITVIFVLRRFHGAGIHSPDTGPPRGHLPPWCGGGVDARP